MAQSLFFLSLLLNLSLLSGCLPSRVDGQIQLEGRPLAVLMQQLGAPLEALEPPAAGEGRIVNEIQKLWHYLTVSSATRLTLVRSQYSSMFTVSQTIIASFDNPGFGTIDVTVVDDEVDEPGGVDSGVFKFTTVVTSPSPGTAHGEIYPFPRSANGQGELYPPSARMTLPPGFAVPVGSQMDPRKRYMKDQASIGVFQNLLRGLYQAGVSQVVLAP